MASSYSNKWLNSSCPPCSSFYVNKSYTKYFIFYFPARKNVTELNADMNKIKTGVNDLINAINDLKNSIDSEDYRSQTQSITNALNDSVKAIQDNMTKLFTSVANRESDAWFGSTALNYANYIRESILKVGR